MKKTDAANAITGQGDRGRGGRGYPMRGGFNTHRNSCPAAGRGVDRHASVDRNGNAGSDERRTLDPDRYCELCNLTSHWTRD